MIKIRLFATLLLVVALMLAGSALAAIVEVPDPGPQYWDSSANAVAFRVRNGVVPSDPNNYDVLTTYAVGLGYTDLSTFTPTVPQLLLVALTPYSAPLWNFNTLYHFTLVYADQGNATAFHLYDQQNNEIFTASTSAISVNDIYTIRLNYAGGGSVLSADGDVKISELTLNGTQMGNQGIYESFLNDNYVYFRNSDGTPFTPNFTISGYFQFTGDYDANTPRFEIDLSSQAVSTAAVPLPGTTLFLWAAVFWG